MAFTLPRDVSATETETGLVLLDQRNGHYWMLNRTGATLLRLLLDGYSPAAAAARVGRDFPDAADRVQDDVLVLVNAHHVAGLVDAA